MPFDGSHIAAAWKGLVITHISEGPAVAGLAIGCFQRKPRRGGLFIG
jgi:hypothetical protein